MSKQYNPALFSSIALASKSQVESCYVRVVTMWEAVTAQQTSELQQWNGNVIKALEHYRSCLQIADGIPADSHGDQQSSHLMES